MQNDSDFVDLILLYTVSTAQDPEPVHNITTELRHGQDSHCPLTT